MSLKSFFLRSFTIAAILFLAASCTTRQPPAKQPANEFSFAFMTDIHVQPENNAEAGFRAAITKVNELNPEFVITGGAVSAAWWEGPYLGTEEGFVLVNVKGDSVSWEYLDYKWKVN